MPSTLHTRRMSSTLHTRYIPSTAHTYCIPTRPTTQALELAKIFPKAPDEWSASLRNQIVFELTKREPWDNQHKPAFGPTDQSVRDFFDLGPPPEPIVVRRAPPPYASSLLLTPSHAS